MPRLTCVKLMAIAQSIAITEEIKFGLGRREATLLDGDMNKLLVVSCLQFLVNFVEHLKNRSFCLCSLFKAVI